MENGQTAPDCPGNQFPVLALPRVRGVYLAQRERRLVQRSLNCISSSMLKFKPFI